MIRKLLAILFCGSVETDAKADNTIGKKILKEMIADDANHPCIFVWSNGNEGGIKSYKPIEQLGPQAQPSHIRINKGDEGQRIKLWFAFKH